MSYGYDPAGGSLTDTKTFTIVNTSGSAITYDLSNHSSATTWARPSRSRRATCACPPTATGSSR